MAITEQITKIQDEGKTIVVEYPSIVISEESSIGIEKHNIIIEHDWKTLRSGKQVMIRTGGAGELNGNDMRKINIAVKAASANPGQMDQIRETLVTGYMPETRDKPIGWRQHRTLLGGTSDWVGSSGSLEAGQMAIANNVMKGRDRHKGLTKRQLLGVKRDEEFGEKYPDSDMLKAVNVQSVFNRNMAKKKFGEKPFTVYRGIYGEQAAAIKAKAKRGDTIRMDSNSLTSFTTNLDIAQKFKSGLGRGKPGIVIQSKVSYKNVFDSYASNSVLTSNVKAFKFDEVIVAPKGLKMTGVIIDD